MTLRSLFRSRSSRDAVIARTALRDASDDVRASLFALDTALACETDTRLLTRITSIIHALAATLHKARRYVHTQHEKRNND